MGGWLDGAFRGKGGREEEGEGKGRAQGVEIQVKG